MIFFLTFTSLAYPQELNASKVGSSVLVLNILIYFSRIIGEYLLFPQPKIFVVLVCLVMVVVYILAFYLSRKQGKAVKTV